MQVEQYSGNPPLATPPEAQIVAVECNAIDQDPYLVRVYLSAGNVGRWAGAGFVDFGAYALGGDVKLEDDTSVDDNIGAAGKIELQTKQTLDEVLGDASGVTGVRLRSTTDDSVDQRRQ